jgi:hypothetical protein
LTTEYFVHESFVACGAGSERGAARVKIAKADLRNCTILHNYDDLGSSSGSSTGREGNAKGTQGIKELHNTAQ